MDTIKEANDRIQKCKNNKIPLLFLDHLDLKPNELKDLIPKIKDIPGLKILNLGYNQLGSIPKEIMQLTQLESLNLTSNELTRIPDGINKLTKLKGLSIDLNSFSIFPEEVCQITSLETFNISSNRCTNIPDNIGNLVKLKSLDMSYNRFASIPDTMGKLTLLEELNLNSNRLTAIPETLSNLKNLKDFGLNLNLNPLRTDSLEWLDNKFADSLVYDMAPSDKFRDYKDTLDQLYGEGSKQVQKRLDSIKFDNQLFVTEVEDRLGGRTVIEEFLGQIPTKDEDPSSIYSNPTKYLIDKVIREDISKGERNTVLQKIATSLGACVTPVKDFLIQTTIAQHAEKQSHLPADVLTLIQREAVEAMIKKDMKGVLPKDEFIEGVAGLSNSLFLEGAENKEKNKVKIDGHRQRMQSKASNEGQSFDFVPEEAVEKFAKAFCKEDKGTLKVNTLGKYVLEPVKLQQVTETYLAGHGLVSDREKLVNKFKEMMNPLLNNSGLGYEHYDKNDVKPLLDIPAQVKKLRTVLYEALDDNLQSVYKQYSNKIVLEVNSTATQYGTNRQETSHTSLRDKSPSPSTSVVRKEPTSPSRARGRKR